MAQAELTVKEFKGGYAVVDPDGKDPIRDDEGRPTGFGEVITRTDTEEEAKDFVSRQKASTRARAARTRAAAKES